MKAKHAATALEGTQAETQKTHAKVEIPSNLTFQFQSCITALYFGSGFEIKLFCLGPSRVFVISTGKISKYFIFYSLLLMLVIILLIV